MTQTVGILGYQGCIEPHEEKLLRLGVRPLRVRTSDELAAVDRLILPGGESTTMLRFIKRYGMLEPLKLFAASALLDGRAAPDPSDFWILKHTWNNLDQAEILDGVVGPVLEGWYREHPESRRVAAEGVGIEALLAEINRIRDLVTGDRPLSDIQLFSQLKALNEIKAALQAMGTEPARQALMRVDQLLGHVFQSGKFAS